MSLVAMAGLVRPSTYFYRIGDYMRLFQLALRDGGTCPVTGYRFEETQPPRPGRMARLIPLCVKVRFSLFHSS